MFFKYKFFIKNFIILINNFKIFNVIKNRTKTDKGKLVENTKIFELIIFKELGNLTP